MAAEVGSDLAAAFTSAVFVAPVVAAVDKAITESSAGRANIFASFTATMRGFLDPRALRRPEFLYAWALFAGTYTINNLVCSAEQHQKKSLAAAKTSGVFAGNMSLAMWKDAAFARIFGGATAAALPPKSYGAWAVRDLTGMSVVFTLPPLLAPKLAAATDMNLRSAETFLQFTLPMAIQPVVAPFHQLGFLFSFKPDAPLSSHWSTVKAQVGGVVVMRWIRGFPPYCVGATMNKNLRYEFRDALGLSNDSVAAPEQIARAVTKPGDSLALARTMTPG